MTPVTDDPQVPASEAPPAPPAPPAESPATQETAESPALEAPTQQMAPAGPPDLACRSCAAPLDAAQRYCLNCGSPVPGSAPSLDSALAQAMPASTATAAPPLPSWRVTRPVATLGAAGAAGLLLLAVLLGALIAGGDDKPQPVRVNVPAAKAPVVNVAAPAAAAAAPAAEAPFKSDWPGGNRWTVRLQTLPKEGTLPSAVAAAKTTAAGSGAKDVGALDSDEHSALDGGQYLVYSGVYRTKAQANRALRGLKRSFPDAAVVRVASGNAKTASDKELGDLKNSSGDDFVDRSRRLPSQVQSQGDAPPKDDAAAGAGDEAEEIG